MVLTSASVNDSEARTAIDIPVGVASEATRHLNKGDTVPHPIDALPEWLRLLWQITICLQFAYFLMVLPWTIYLTGRRIRRWLHRRRA
jgi:hypothetical protein